MAKKLSDIVQQIHKKELLFQSFLDEKLGNEISLFLTELLNIGNLYLFSGIIRDYFLDIPGIRDVDIMIDTQESINHVLEKYQYRRNSFGGYKITINSISIDLWHLKDTWALNNAQTVFDLDIEKYVPNTSFFNFSSIIYSFKEKKFIYSKAFLRFLRDRKIDYVFKPNASYALCVVNSFYYNDKLHLEFTERLKKYLLKLNRAFSCEYEAVQVKHFGKVLYKKDYIEHRIKQLNLSY